MTLFETPLVENDITFTQFRTGTEIRDIRKAKQYTRRVVLLAFFEQSVERSGSSPFVRLEEKLKEAFAQVEPSVETYVAGGWGKHEISIVFSFHAEKPSLVISEEMAWRRLPWSPQGAARILMDVCCKAHDEWKEEKALDERVAQANHLVGWVTKTFNARAKAHIYYEERLEKLKEEYALAAQAAFATGWEETQKEILEKHPEYDPRSVSAAFAAARPLVGQPEDPFSMRTPSVAKDEVR